MPSELTVTFEFEVGAELFFKTAQHTGSHRPMRFVVVSQVAERCSGGTQLFYRLCNRKDPVAEIALTRDEPVYRPPSEEHIASEIAIRARRYEAERNSWDHERAGRQTRANMKGRQDG